LKDEKMETRSGVTEAGRIFDRFLRVLAVLAGIIVSFITVAVCVGIVSRYVFNYPISWVVEICEYGLLYITFLVAAWVLMQEQHVSVDLVYSRLSPGSQSIASLFTSVGAAIVFLIITYYGLKVTKHQFDTKYFTPTILEAPKFAITLIIPVGSFLLLIQIIRKTWRHIKDLTQPPTPGSEKGEAVKSSPKTEA
jgi:TRAP-type C4-dicarboxylate transport system permease small subunit